jgi:hypothetical protein
MPLTEERYAERIKRQRKLIAEMLAAKPVPEIVPTDWNFGLTPDQLDDFLQTLNGELAAEEQSINEWLGKGDDG